MAQLNVREHRIEAKIAYVGPATTGITATFERLLRESAFHRAPAGADWLAALEWRPARRAAFSDHDIVVKVVVPREERFAEVLPEIDGVVFVGAPDGASDGPYLAALREQLGRVERATMPLLVQEHELATLESALGEVLASLQRPGDRRDPRVEDAAHPLLSALREVLRETAREQADALADRVCARLEARLAELDRRLEAVEAKTADDSLALHMIQTLDETEVRLRAVDGRITEIVEEMKRPKKSWFT